MRAIRCVVAALLAAGIVAVVGAQPPRGGGGGQVDVYALVLSNAALQEDVKLTDAQKEKFKPLAEKQADLAKKNRDLFAKGFKDFDKEKAAELRKDGEKLAEEVKKAIDDTLTDTQKKRLKQISVQVMNVTVFADPDTKFGQFNAYNDAQKATMKEATEALKLNDSQKSKIKDILAEHNKDRDAIRKDVFGDKKGGGFDPEKQKDFAEKTGKLATETMGKISEALDEGQKKAWKELVGEAFDTNKLRPAPPPKKD